MDMMQIEATERTPKIEFDFNKNHFSISGESYPEDISEFYGTILHQLTSHMSGLRGVKVTFDFDLIYFNSSSAKVIMRLFETMEEAAEEGNTVVVNWYYEEDDDNMEEMGEEFSEDLEKATFNLLPKSN